MKRFVLKKAQAIHRAFCSPALLGILNLADRFACVVSSLLLLSRGVECLSDVLGREKQNLA